jgi:eukaryotic-like serine/threonine-protein kinase
VTTLTATGQVIAERYALTRFVAGGSMGEVWEATDTRMQRVVAVKVLRPEFARDADAVERFRTEARLAARLMHPGIARVHDVDDGRSTADPPWMVQEYVPGRPLSDLLKRAGRLAPQQAADLIGQAAVAVHAAHEAGVVHRDLTPGNLLVTDDDAVKITDFGIARAAGLVPLTATGQVLGAAAYLSPEQVQGRPATAASDVYTLGVVLYECLAGARPFTGANPVEVARAHLDQAPVPLPASVPETFRAVTAAAMAKDPADRPRTAAELATLLRAARTELVPGRTSSVPGDSGDHDRSSRTSEERNTRPLPRVYRAAAPLTATLASTASATLAAARDEAQTLWRAWSPVVMRQLRLARERYPVSRFGVAGTVMLLLVVLAVIWGGPRAAGAPSPGATEPGAGTVRVVDDPGKGQG